MTYRPRTVDKLLADKLAHTYAVLIEGPKACGKTETARHAASSEVLLDIDRPAQAALDVDPALVLAGSTPRLLDEWQVGGTTLWNTVRRTVDERRQPGQFILTGSATPRDDVDRHTGSGRIGRIRMRPMCLFEQGRSTAQVSIASLFDGETPACADPGLSVFDILDLITVGGWPMNLTRDVEQSRKANIDYLANVIEFDVPTVGGYARQPRALGRAIETLARNTSTTTKIAVLARETEGPDGVARSTIYQYLDALDRLMVSDDVPAWPAHLRSATRLLTEPKRHFTDPSLAVAALRATPARLMADLNYAGLLFESMVVRDLRALVAPLDGEVHHARLKNQAEADVVVTLPDGRWAAFEVKLGPERIDDAAASIQRFASNIDTAKSGEPSALGVITNATYGYRRADGVVVLPIGALAP